MVAGLGYVTADLPAEDAPEASFEASDLENGTVAVEHVGSEPVEGLRVLVYEDPRFESGQRLVVRWFGGDGRTNLAEERL